MYGLMDAPPAQASQEAALQALMMQVSQQPQEAAFQAAVHQEPSSLEAMMTSHAQLQDPSSLQAMMASHANLQALMSAQQARSRLLTAAVETFQDPNCTNPRTISPEFSQAAASLLGNQANLDVMTERFIKQSMERMMERQVIMSQMGQQQNGFGV